MCLGWVRVRERVRTLLYFIKRYIKRNAVVVFVGKNSDQLGDLGFSHIWFG